MSRSRSQLGLAIGCALAACAPAPAPPRQEPATGLGPALELYFASDFEGAARKMQELLEAGPEDTEVRGWLAEALLRGGNHDSAEKEALRTLSVDSCNSGALMVLARLRSPQYKLTPETDADSAIALARKAVRCDPTDGNAWLQIWTTGLLERRPAMVDEAVARIMEIGFIPRSVMSFGRWLLESTPRDGILFLTGDWDYFPVKALQHSEGVRPDVLIVLVPALHTPAYVSALVSDHDLLPSMGLAGDWARGGAGSYHEYFIGALVDSRIEGRLGRPLVVPITTSPDPFRREHAHFHPAGPGWVVGAEDSAPPVMDDLRYGTDRISPEALGGPTAVESDRSPVRRGDVPPADRISWVLRDRADHVDDPQDLAWIVDALAGLVSAGVLSPWSLQEVEEWLQVNRGR